jgi:hypothetical protein
MQLTRIKIQYREDKMRNQKTEKIKDNDRMIKRDRKTNPTGNSQSVRRPASDKERPEFSPDDATS